jgi:hypothetical protein
MRATIYQDEPLPDEFCQLIRSVEGLLGVPVWLLVQNTPRDEAYSQISMSVYKGFQSQASEIPDGGRAALLIESPGGLPDFAYRIARLFQRRAARFTVVVPQYAKSAATLLALGADDLILGRDAELGPLDLQIFDPREERYDSALNTVQSLERLSAYSLPVVDQLMLLLMRRLAKRSDVLLPQALNYVASLMKPLLDKVDTVDYSRKSRDLKVTEEYAARLMRRAYGFAKGKEIARSLVENYPAHGFVIDTDEALSHSGPNAPDDQEAEFGLHLRARRAASDLQTIFDMMVPHLDRITAVGRIRVMP